MRRHAQPRVALAAIVASGAVATATIAAVGGDRGDDVGASASAAKHQAHLRVHGKVGGLYPGVHKKLHVHVRNTSQRRPMWVKAVRTKVNDASAACTGEELHAKHKKKTNTRVPPQSPRDVNVKVRMPSSAPDECQGVSWPLDYKVRVKRK